MREDLLIQYTQRGFFILVSSLFLLFYLVGIALPLLELSIGILLFFLLGISHGSLDIAVAELLFKPRLGNQWKFYFFFLYLSLVLAVLLCWIAYPFFSFSFFLFISFLHFGLSDTKKRSGFDYYLEVILRGVLPIVPPAYFYPIEFQSILESSLEESSAIATLSFLELLFIPTVILLLLVTTLQLLKKRGETIENGLELILLFILFYIFQPFKAFLIYFCFLHSLRHTFHVVKETGHEYNLKGLRFVVKEAFYPTLVTFFFFFIGYLIFSKSLIDQKVFFNLFFAGVAALTFPHMLLIEATDLISKRSKPYLQ